MRPQPGAGDGRGPGQAIKGQVWQKAAETGYTRKLDLTQDAVALCPECGARTKP
jgi:hypothetical protein